MCIRDRRRPARNLWKSPPMQKIPGWPERSDQDPWCIGNPSFQNRKFRTFTRISRGTAETCFSGWKKMVGRFSNRNAESVDTPLWGHSWKLMPVIHGFKLKFRKKPTASGPTFTDHIKFANPRWRVRFETGKWIDSIDRMRFRQPEISRLPCIPPTVKIVQTPTQMVISLLKPAFKGFWLEFNIALTAWSKHKNQRKKGKD